MAVRNHVAAADRTSTRALPAVVLLEAVLDSEGQEGLMDHRRGRTMRQKYNTDPLGAIQPLALRKCKGLQLIWREIREPTMKTKDHALESRKRLSSMVI